MSGFSILVVPSSSTPEAESGGTHAAARLRNTDHAVIGPRTVKGGLAALQQALRTAAAEEAADVVLVIGGVGVGADDVSPAAVDSLASRKLPGFGQILRLNLFRSQGNAAALDRSTAAIVGPAVAFAIPADPDTIDLALDEIILPEIRAFTAGIRAGAAVPEPADDDVEDAVVEVVEDEEDGPTLPPPEPRWRLGTRSAVTMEASPITAEAPTDADGNDVPDKGWKRAVYDLEAEGLRGKAPDVPQNIESHAPILDVLHHAGEYAQLKFNNGNRATIYGYPDLQRANSKVLLVGWGEPLAEVVALHRYPIQSGTCIEEERGLMPGRNADIAEIAEAVTGRAPADTSGELFAVDHDRIYVQRGKWIYSWDGRKERQEGNAKQALTSMVVHWHQR